MFPTWFLTIPNMNVNQLPCNLFFLSAMKSAITWKRFELKSNVLLIKIKRGSTHTHTQQWQEYDKCTSFWRWFRLLFGIEFRIVPVYEFDCVNDIHDDVRVFTLTTQKPQKNRLVGWLFDFKCKTITRSWYFISYNFGFFPSLPPSTNIRESQCIKRKR